MAAMKILVADDNYDAVSSLAALLEDEGHDVRGVYRNLARWLRSRHPKRCPLLIAVSGAFTRPADEQLSRVSGFHHYLAKPYSFAELLPLLR